MASDVVDCDGLPFVLALTTVELRVGTEVCDCDCDEWVLFAADEAVPLVVGGAALGGGGERLAVEALLVVTDWLLLDLRVEPTSFRKRWFMDDMET